MFNMHISSPTRDVASMDASGLTTSPLVIQTTQQLGLQVPLGLIINETRTSADQALVFDEINGTVYLESSSSTTNPESILETSLVQNILRDGFSTQRYVNHLFVVTYRSFISKKLICLLVFSSMSTEQSLLADPENILDSSNIYHPLVVNNVKDLNSTQSSSDSNSPLFTFLVSITNTIYLKKYNFEN